MAQYIKSLKRVVQNGDNKTLEEYDFAVKAENVIVTTSDGNEETVQDALLQFTEPTTFTLDNSQTNWNVDNKISWQMICDSLENNTIQNYLKAGDEIDIQVGNETLPFFVLGVNTYNGQPRDQFGKSHIDLGCPQMSKILAAMTGPSLDVNTEFPLGDIDSNSGAIEDTISYATMFERSFFKKLNNIGYNHQSFLRQVLLLDDSLGTMIKPKMLFLDKRLGLSKEVENNLKEIFPKNRETTLQDFILLVNNFPETYKKDPPDWDYSQITVDLDTNPTGIWEVFYSSYVRNFLENHANGSGATHLQRILILLKNGLIDRILRENFTQSFIAHIASYMGFIAINQWSNINKTEMMQFIACICYYIWRQLEQKSVMYSTDSQLVYSEGNNSPLFWSLTEMDIFGECIFGSREYSQGQLFQYPFFQNLLAKKRFISSLSTDKNFMTITPVDGTIAQIVGYSKENNESFLCARPFDLPTYQSSGKGTYDVALCFRLQV